jgi:hypothetical protein
MKSSSTTPARPSCCRASTDPERGAAGAPPLFSLTGNSLYHFGKHNKEWAAMMKAVGLIPSDTAAPGGREVGQKVSHPIEAGGRFERACAELVKQGFDPLYVELERGRREDAQEEGRQQDPLQLPGVRHERMGEARRAPGLWRMRRTYGGRN